MNNTDLTSFLDELVEAKLLDTRVGTNGEPEFKSTALLQDFLKKLSPSELVDMLDGGNIRLEEVEEIPSSAEVVLETETSPQRVFESDSDYAYRMINNGVNKK
tara:strand:+ start:1338 stop:1646 length:309 start_codon:yes stop_codon:yes gene_type:complete